MKIQTESGRSLVEMLGVLTIIGILGAGAISSLNFGMESMRVGTLFNEVEATAQHVRDLYSWNREYPGPDAQNKMNSKICNNNVFDTDCKDNKAVVDPPWGELQVLVGSGKKEANGEEFGNGEYFTIKLTGIPETACTRLLSYEWTNVYPITTACSGATDMVFLGY